MLEDSICDKNSAPSVSSISRVLRGGTTDIGLGDEQRTNHSIDGILGKPVIQSFIIENHIFIKVMLNLYHNLKNCIVMSAI